MVKKNRTQKALTVLLGVAILYLSGCANQLPPGGGETDTTPPAILESFPADGTVLYQKNYVELTFSEYIDKRSFIDALFISPALPANPEFDWSGKSVRILFPDSLGKSTYTISVGTDVVDLNNKNRMAAAFTTRFSRSPKIDRGVIRGRVYAEKPSGIFVFAYRMDSAGVELKDRKPDYVSQVGDSGTFALAGLSPGKFRVFAVKDEYKDYLFQSEQDYIGIPPTDCILSETDTLADGLHFILQKLDTLKPRLISAAMTDRNHVLAVFSKDIRISSSTKSSIEVIDSASQMKYFPEAVFKGRGRPKEYFLGFRDSIRQSDALYLFVRDITDDAGNRSDSDAVSLFFTSRPDTTAASVFRIEPVNNSKDNILDLRRIVVGFDDFASQSRGNILVADSAKKLLPCFIDTLDDATFALRPRQPLQPSMVYDVKIDFSKWRDYSGKALDSVFVSKFTAVSDIDLTGLFGVVQGFDTLKNPVLTLQSSEKTELEYSQSVPSTGAFGFDKINPGKYKLFFYYDLNQNGKYDRGTLNPWSFSEPGLYFRDEILLNPRWAVTELTFPVEILNSLTVK